MTSNQAGKGEAFRRLHERPGAFVIPNPWDVGTARVLASMGFEALATTSAGLAFSLGLPEGVMSRDQALTHCREIVLATDLPVSADLEKGFGDDPVSFESQSSKLQSRDTSAGWAQITSQARTRSGSSHRRVRTNSVLQPALRLSIA